MKSLALIFSIVLGSLFLQYCSDGTTTTLSSLGLTGNFRYTDTENGSTYCRKLDNASLTGTTDNVSQYYKVSITDNTITITNTVYDNYSAAGGFCTDATKLYTVSQTFNVVSIGSASTATAIDNDSTVAGAGSAASDNYTTRVITGTVGATTVTCHSEGGQVADNRGCTVLATEQLCGNGVGQWDNGTAYNVNGAYRCYNAGTTAAPVSYGDHLTKYAGILIDNNTLRVPTEGSTAYLTLGYYDNGTSTRHISVREFMGPNVNAGAETTTNYGRQTHTAFYFNTGGTAQDNITAYWGGSDNLSNLLVPISS